MMRYPGFGSTIRLLQNLQDFGGDDAYSPTSQSHRDISQQWKVINNITIHNYRNLHSEVSTAISQGKQLEEAMADTFPDSSPLHMLSIAGNAREVRQLASMMQRVFMGNNELRSKSAGRQLYPLLVCWGSLLFSFLPTRIQGLSTGFSTVNFFCATICLIQSLIVIGILGSRPDRPLPGISSASVWSLLFGALLVTQRNSQTTINRALEALGAHPYFQNTAVALNGFLAEEIPGYAGARGAFRRIPGWIAAEVSIIHSGISIETILDRCYRHAQRRHQSACTRLASIYVLPGYLLAGSSILLAAGEISRTLAVLQERML